MKLTINSGESVDHAIEYITDFLSSLKEEYPLLKGNMNIYITLEGFGHKYCPENCKEYILTGETIEDVEHHRICEAKEMLKCAWKKYVQSETNRFLVAANKVTSAESSLTSAVTRKLTEKTIELRKKNVAHAQDLLTDARGRCDIVLKLNKAVEDGNAILYTEKKVKDKKTVYSYTITPYFIFEDIDGYTGYFRAQKSQTSVYGYLEEGLPYNYKKQAERD